MKAADKSCDLSGRASDTANLVSRIRLGVFEFKLDTFVFNVKRAKSSEKQPHEIKSSLHVLASR